MSIYEGESYDSPSIYGDDNMHKETSLTWFFIKIIYFMIVGYYILNEPHHTFLWVVYQIALCGYTFGIRKQLNGIPLYVFIINIIWLFYILIKSTQSLL